MKPRRKTKPNLRAPLLLGALALALAAARPAAAEGIAPDYIEEAKRTVVGFPVAPGLSDDGIRSSVPPFPGLFGVDVRGSDGRVLQNAVVKMNGTSYRTNEYGQVMLDMGEKTPQVDVEISAPGYETTHKRIFAKPEHREVEVRLDKETEPFNFVGPTH